MGWNTYNANRKSRVRDTPKKPIDWQSLFGTFILVMVILGVAAFIVLLIVAAVHTDRENGRWDAWCLAEGGMVTTPAYAPEEEKARVDGRVVCVRNNEILGSRDGEIER